MRGVLHLQITSLPRGRAIALCDGQITETRLATFDLTLIPADDVVRVVLGTGDFGLAPRRGPPGLSVLDEQVGRPDLALETLLARSVRTKISCVVLAHVVLQRLTVGLCRRLPS